MSWARLNNANLIREVFKSIASVGLIATTERFIAEFECQWTGEDEKTILTAAKKIIAKHKNQHKEK
jgi:hypothetical protein